MTSGTTAAWYALLTTRGVGPRTALKILAHARARGCTLESLILSGAIGQFISKDPPTRSKMEEAADVIADLALRGVLPVSIEDTDYPHVLKASLGRDAPPLLFLRGDLKVLGTPMVAVVGSRDVGDRTIAAARSVAGSLAKAGITVVSGYASGVDRAAHNGALAAGGCTAAVLPYGVDHFKWSLDRAEPAAHGRFLALTTFLPRQPWSAGAAMERNRYVLGLASAAVVVAARISGGTMNTAEHARRMKVPLFALDFDSSDAEYEGNRNLFAAGALAIRKDRVSGDPRIGPVVEAVRSSGSQGGALPLLCPETRGS